MNCKTEWDQKICTVILVIITFCKKNKKIIRILQHKQKPAKFLRHEHINKI